MTEKENLILKSETAYELGGGSSQAVSAIAFTQDKGLVSEDAVYLVGMTCVISRMIFHMQELL